MTIEYRRFGTINAAAALLLVAALAGCAARQDRVTKRDNTGKGAGIGAAAGAVLGAVIGEGEADEILASAAIGAGIGAGVGSYMDRQEERLATIPGTTVERVGDDMLLLRFDSDVLFDTDSASPKAGSEAAMRRVADVLIEYKKTAIVVQGHTDSQGSETYNEQLSRRRADAVEGYLVGQGIQRDRITSIGRGEAYPVASNDTAAGRERNRRVDLLLKAKAT